MSGGRAASSRICASPWRVPRSRATRNGSWRGRAPLSRLRSATTRTGRSQVPTRGACLVTRGAMRMRCCARGWKSSAAGSVARIGFSSTRTTTSIVKQRCGPGWRSTARTRWPSPGGSAPGSFSARSSPTWRSSRTSRSLSTAGRADSASTRAPRERSTSPVCSMRRSASPTGRRHRQPFRSRIGSSSGKASTAVTSARTSVRGTEGSRSVVPGLLPKVPNRCRRFRSGTGSSEMGKSSSRNSIASTSRATILAGCDETRSSPQGNAGSPEIVPAVRALRGERRSRAARRGRLGARADRSTIRMTQSDRERLAVLVHEVRSPVAALRAIAETCQGDRLGTADRRRLVELAIAACLGIERLRRRCDGFIGATGTGRRRPSGRGGGGSGEARRRERSCGDRRRACRRSIADPVRLRQAFDNLVIERAPPRRVLDGGADTRAGRVGATVLLSVADRGPGIPIDEQERIFEPGCSVG